MEEPKSPASEKTKKKQKSEAINHRQAWGPVPGVKVTHAQCCCCCYSVASWGNMFLLHLYFFSTFIFA